MKLNSSIWLDGSELKNLTACSRRGILGGLGYARGDIARKPIIGIVNSYTEINPGHAHLDKVAEAVKQGVLMAGGVPFEFNTPAPCDATSCGLEPMKYILPQRDLIADSIEMMVRRPRVHLLLRQDRPRPADGGRAIEPAGHLRARRPCAAPPVLCSQG